jgi:putative hydrolase of the HAD superfamily
MPQIEMVWFDFGGVLSPPISNLFQTYATKTGVAAEALQRAMMVVADELGVPMLEPIECGLLTEAEWGRRLRSALKRDYPSLDLSAARLERFGEQWFEGVGPNAEMVAAVRHLKGAGKSVGILTNNVIEWEEHWRAMLGLDDVVDFIVDSCKEGCRKPEARFFQIACDRAGTRASHCLLIDDLQENVQAARNFGWNAILFTNNRDVQEQIECWTGVSLVKADSTT